MNDDIFNQSEENSIDYIDEYDNEMQDKLDIKKILSIVHENNIKNLINN
jgi:hypothetical protein